MPRITLEAGDDHVQALAHEKDPLRAVLELIWNGLDADADHVWVTLERNDHDGIDGVIVADDGDGIAPEAIESAFRPHGVDVASKARLRWSTGMVLRCRARSVGRPRLLTAVKSPS